MPEDEQDGGATGGRGQPLLLTLPRKHLRRLGAYGAWSPLSR